MTVDLGRGYLCNASVRTAENARAFDIYLTELDFAPHLDVSKGKATLVVENAVALGDPVEVLDYGTELKMGPAGLSVTSPQTGFLMTIGMDNSIRGQYKKSVFSGSCTFSRNVIRLVSLQSSY